MKKKIAVLTCAWSTHFVKDFLRGMQNAIEGKDIDLYIFNAYNYTEFSGFLNFTGFSIFGIIHYEDFDGIIVMADLINSVRILEKERLRIIKSGKPAITINKKLQGLTCIRVDNYTGLYKMMEHLIIEHGYKDFAYISGRELSTDIAERYKAYRTALYENNIKIDADQVFRIESNDYHCAYHFFEEFIKEGRKLPEVFVCANDLIALALLKVCKENNIAVPDKLKIVGYDDMVYSNCTTPTLATIRSNTEYVGGECVKRIIAGDTDELNLVVKSTPIFRDTCGCKSDGPKGQTSLLLNILDDDNKKEEFNTQMEILGELFTEAADVFTLLTNLESHLALHHSFEGRDFCLFMKSDWNSVLINSSENLPQNLSYGQQVQAICSVQNNKKYLREMIEIRDLVPAKMKTEGSNIFLFLPIFHHSYVHGYYVAKNNLSMIDNHYGYIWARSMGTNIERFRKKNMYKQMSQQYLRLSTRDALSGMLNRAGLEKITKPFFASNKKNGLTTVLFFVDINKMKHINDNYGHLHGDLAVKTVAAAVLEVVPKNWHCIRYGGDEFLVVGNSHNYNGEDYCTKIKERLNAKVAIMHLPYDLSASVGNYLVPANSDLTLEQAVENVDDIMYEQKQAYHKTH